MNKQLISCALGLALFTSCADEFKPDYAVSQPADLAAYSYLKDYQPLKSYIDRTAHPNFKLGVGVGVSDYLDQSLVYSLVTSNFDEMTAGNAMKYASCVSDNGSMDFSTVMDFVSAAQTAGMTIYGHTLAWHSQQNLKYLNSLIADKEVEIDPNASNDVQDMLVTYSDYSDYPYYRMSDLPYINADGNLEIDNTDEGLSNWQVQYFTMDGCTFTKGNDYLVTAKIKGSSAGSLGVFVGDWSGQISATMPFSDEWQEVTVEIPAVTAESGFVFFQSGGFVGNLEVEWVKLHHKEAMAVNYYESLISNGDAEGTETGSFISRYPGQDDANSKIVADPFGGDGHVYEIPICGNPSTAWDAQFFIKSNIALEAGEKVHVSFRYRGTDERQIDSQAHGEPGSYHHWQFVGSLNTTPSAWKTLEYTGTISSDQAGSDGCKSIAFNLSSTSAAATLYVDDVVFEVERSGNTIPLTAEEKKENLSAALKTWIYGMMDACGGYVTAWDVVNEALAGGGDDGEGNYPLQSGEVNGDTSSSFYWQDYLGSLDYVRLAVKYAREGFAESGGNAADLKLFINDYNLESDWDDNKKLKSLINWIAKWEADGETRLDGISSQMHISYYANAATQESKKNHVVKMLELLASTGKLVKISELDMGYVDENGTTLKTSEITEEQHKQMSEYYQFIIEKYFELIPAAQQYGITQWCITDSPANSGWRASEPVGLWDENYNRKHVYAGFADGLSGK
jgi:GH35 family endo-1,4-beta-xylanase